MIIRIFVRRIFFVNVFPILAYQKIYQDHFRWEQWENADPSTYNVDFYDGTPATPFYGTLPAENDEYWQNPNMFDLRYVNFNKDLFMGVLPETQFWRCCDGDRFFCWERFFPRGWYY